ncbi:MAG: hypothetical protein AB1806_03195 [Acidobacteriota bacterium]
MTAEEALLAVIDALEQVGTAYVLVGSLATNFHGIPRSTRDADVVVAMDETTLRRLAAVLHPALRIQPQASFEFYRVSNPGYLAISPVTNRASKRAWISSTRR